MSGSAEGAEFWRHLAGQQPKGPAPAQTPPAALPAAEAASAHADPPAPDQTFDVEQLIGELREAARGAGLQRGDPMMPLLVAFARSIRFLAQRNAASDQTVADASQRISDALLLARQVAATETDRFHAELAAAEAATVARISTAIADSADAALTRRVRVFDRTAAFLAAFVLVVTAAGCLAGGYWWGSHRAYADINETAAGLRAAFRESVQDA